MAFTILKNATLSIDGVDYSDDVDNVTITPSVERYEWKPISGNKETQLSEIMYEVSFNAAQDFSTPTSIAMKSISSVGDAVSAIFKPRGIAGPTFGCEIVLAPIASIGGAVGGLSGQITCAVNGGLTIVEG